MMRNRSLPPSGEYQTQGAVHEVEAIADAAQEARLIMESLLEPSVDQELVARCPVWKDRLGCPALALPAAEKNGVEA